MALLSKKEFAAQCLWETKKLSVYIQRKQVIVKKGATAADDLIDTTNPVNKAFLEKYGYTKAVTAAPQALPAATEAKTKPDMHVPDLKLPDNPDDAAAFVGSVDWSQILPYHKAEQLKAHWDAIKSERAAEKLKLENEKKQGEVVPVEPIETLVFQFKQHVQTSEKTADEKILNEMAHKYNMSPEDIAYCRGQQIKYRNEAMKQATENFKVGLEATLKEYSAKRGVGERG